MGVFLCLFFHNRHSTLITCVGSRALLLLVVHNVHSLHLGAAVNAWYEDVWANSLMLFDILPDTFSFAHAVSEALDWRVLAQIVVVAHFLVAKHFLAAQILVVAYELRVFELFLHLFFHVDEFGLVTQHGTLTCFFSEFIEADLVVSVVTHLTLPGVYKDGLT
jgi:hypothetical protein